MNQPIICEPAEGRNYYVWGDRYSFKTTSADTNGAHALMEMTVNPGSATPPHIHHAEDEMFYVVDGELSLWCGPDRMVARPGAFVAVPKGTIHRWANESGEPVRCLVFLVPAGFDEFLMKIGTPITSPDQVAVAPTKEEIESAISIAGDYNMEVVEP